MTAGTPAAPYLLDSGLAPAGSDPVAELYLPESQLTSTYFDSARAAAEFFVADPFAGPGRRMYRTSNEIDDAAEAATDRELAQVRFALAGHPAADRVLVHRRPGGDGPVAVCVAAACVTGSAPAAGEFRELATELLPARLVPAAIAVTGGPVDTTGAAVAPRTTDDPATRRLLGALFAEALDAAEVGPDDSFLDLGGHSVTAMVLVSRINAALGVRLSLVDLFHAPTVRQLQAALGARRSTASPFEAADSQYLTLADSRGVHCLWPAGVAVPGGWSAVHGPAAREDCLDHADRHWVDFSSAAGRPTTPDGGTGRIPLSFNQEFFRTLDSGAAAGAFSDRHVLVSGWRVRGPLSLDDLRLALDDVVARHEVLRTSIRPDSGGAYQEVHPPSPVSLEVRDLVRQDSDRQDPQVVAERFLAEIEARPFSVTELPLLRASLGRLAEQDHVLVLTAHHVAIDAWSMQVLIRDLAGCYAIRRGFADRLPPVHQYREYCLAQRAVGAEQLRPALDYWRNTLDGARTFTLPVSAVAVPAGQTRYAMRHFSLDGELAGSSLRLARQTGTSPFMLLLAAFYLLAHRLTGTADLVVPTFTPGRQDARFHDTVGPFLNYLPVRTDLTGCRTFRQVLERTRASCLRAYAHDIPFPHIDKVAPDLATGAGSPVAFEIVQPPAPVADDTVGDLRITEVHRRLMFDTGAPDIPDGMLWVLSVLSDAEILGTVQFQRGQFDAAAVTELVTGYREVLRQAVEAPDDELLPIPATLWKGHR